VATLTALPARFDAGTTVKYTRTLADFPANGGWSLALYISGAAYFTVAGSASGASFDFTIAATKTATVAITTGATTSGSKTVSRSAGSFTTDGVLPGYLVHGTGIPSGAYVKSVESATSLTISEAAEATGTALALTFRFPPGAYSWQERATHATEGVKTAASGQVLIDPDPVNAPAGALQPKEEQWLALVEDVIEGRISSDAAAYQIGERAKTFNRLQDWIDFRSHLKAVIAQRRTAGKFRTARVAFTGVGAET